MENLKELRESLLNGRFRINKPQSLLLHELEIMKSLTNIMI